MIVLLGANRFRLHSTAKGAKVTASAPARLEREGDQFHVIAEQACTVAVSAELKGYVHTVEMRVTKHEPKPEAPSRASSPAATSSEPVDKLTKPKPAN